MSLDLNQSAQKIIHKQILANQDKVCAWFSQKAKGVPHPIYSSYDIRDAGYKVSNVDANIFPAGFNNICPTDKETSIDLMTRYFEMHYGSAARKVLLVTEEHTNNPYYWENVATLKWLMESSGREVLLGIPKRLETPLRVTSSTGKELTVVSAFADSTAYKEFSPDIVISNNDFSDSNVEWAEQNFLPMNPPRELGWYQRKKSRYFKLYNDLVNELADVAQFDPWLLKVETEIFEHFEITDDASRELLAKKVDEFLENLKNEYEKRGITRTPFAFVKNNSGTYGLAVIRVASGDEVRSWNYKSRKKMKAAKGGKDVEEVIIQEGIPTIVQAEGVSAEPVIYMLGCELAGGFLRTHGEKDATESLNSPGAVYKRLCVSDLAVDLAGCPHENVYGWSAKLGLLAIALEGQEMGVTYKAYQNPVCG
ncbi:MAG: glutamate--cysteine ligase [Pseudobdellovibrionaceae bacterium]